VFGVEKAAGSDVQLGRRDRHADGLDAVHAPGEVQVDAEVRVRFREQRVGGGGGGAVLVAVVGLGEQPRRRLGLVAPVVVVVVRRRGFPLSLAPRCGSGGEGRGREGLGRVGERAEEGRDGEALVAARERVGRVDVGVAGGAERGGVGAAGDGGGGVLADLAQPDARVAGPGAVRPGVAAGAQERAVLAAVQPRRLRGARVAGPGAHHAPVTHRRLLLQLQLHRGVHASAVCSGRHETREMLLPAGCWCHGRALEMAALGVFVGACPPQRAF